MLASNEKDGKCTKTFFSAKKWKEKHKRKDRWKQNNDDNIKVYNKKVIESVWENIVLDSFFWRSYPRKLG